MGQPAYELVQFHYLSCAACGIPFAVTTEFESSRREDHETFFCPSGHSNFYPQQSKTEQIQKQLDAERKRREWVERDLVAAQRDRDHNERRRRAAQGKATLLKKRIGKGSCPCCKAKFPDLQAHIAEKHPGYGE